MQHAADALHRLLAPSRNILILFGQPHQKQIHVLPGQRIIQRAVFLPHHADHEFRHQPVLQHQRNQRRQPSIRRQPFRQGFHHARHAFDLRHALQACAAFAFDFPLRRVLKQVIVVNPAQDFLFRHALDRHLRHLAHFQKHKLFPRQGAVIYPAHASLRYQNVYFLKAIFTHVHYRLPIHIFQ